MSAVKTVEDLEIYQMAVDLAEEIWMIVIKWDYFAKDTIGKQLVRAADSVAANISEGYGRYHYKENRQFSYFSRGSLYEVKTWLLKAKNRNLISEGKYKKLFETVIILLKKLNNYINSIGKTKSMTIDPDQ